MNIADIMDIAKTIIYESNFVRFHRVATNLVDDEKIIIPQKLIPIIVQCLKQENLVKMEGPARYYIDNENDRSILLVLYRNRNYVEGYYVANY